MDDNHVKPGVRNNQLASSWIKILQLNLLEWCFIISIRVSSDYSQLTDMQGLCWEVINVRAINWISLDTSRSKAIKWILVLTRGPLGHLLDTAIRCFRAVSVGITKAEKMAVEKLQFH